MVASGLSCSAACGILVPWPGIKPRSPALQSRFLTSGLQEKYPFGLHFISLVILVDVKNQEKEKHNQFFILKWARFVPFPPISFLRASLMDQVVKNLPAIWETQVQFLVGKIPWRREWQPTPVFLPEKVHGQSSLVSYSPWGRKESDTTEWLTLSLSPISLLVCLLTSLVFVSYFWGSWFTEFYWVSTAHSI